LNLHGSKLPLAPQASASANSATPARVARFTAGPELKSYPGSIPCQAESSGSRVVTVVLERPILEPERGKSRGDPHRNPFKPRGRIGRSKGCRRRRETPQGRVTRAGSRGDPRRCSTRPPAGPDQAREGSPPWPRWRSSCSGRRGHRLAGHRRFRSQSKTAAPCSMCRRLGRGRRHWWSSPRSRGRQDHSMSD
jgi:hypothetical protein